MAEPPPSVVVLAGPNGAGKSTLAPDLLQGALQVTEFVDADVIARKLSPVDTQGAAITAGREMLKRIRDLARQGGSLAFETTLASRSFLPWLRSLTRLGYQFHLVFLWLPSADFAVARVADRVRLGGHDVPEGTIRRRYAAGIRNFFGLYRPLATSWRVYDSSPGAAPRLVAYGRGRRVLGVRDRRVWNLMAQERGR